jgi:hypothetical protein
MLIPERICTLSLVSTAAGVFRTTVSDIVFHSTTLEETGCFCYSDNEVDHMGVLQRSRIAQQEMGHNSETSFPIVLSIHKELLRRNIAGCYSVLIPSATFEDTLSVP